MCVKVCRCSHPDTATHALVRRLIRRNPLARRLALWRDDIFYGRRRKTRHPVRDRHAQD